MIVIPRKDAAIREDLNSISVFFSATITHLSDIDIAICPDNSPVPFCRITF